MNETMEANEFLFWNTVPEPKKKKKHYTSPRRHMPDWTESEKRFLTSIYKLSIRYHNRHLALICSAMFEREINENAIKGMLTRLRAAGIISFRRSTAQTHADKLAAQHDVTPSMLMCSA
jgi:hypothetical protein